VLISPRSGRATRPRSREFPDQELPLQLLPLQLLPDQEFPDQEFPDQLLPDQPVIDTSPNVVHAVKNPRAVRLICLILVL